MGTLFYLSEIVKFAIEKEKQSVRLYQTLSNRVQNPLEREIFEKLVIEEKAHESFYEVLLSTIPNEQTPGVTEGEEYANYMRELITSGRSVAELSLNAGSDDWDKIFDYAISREKDSILFYLGLKQYVPKKAYDYIGHIIEEEAKHISILLNMRKNKETP